MTASTADSALPRDKPFEVPGTIGQVKLLVAHSPQQVGTTVMAFTHRSPAKFGLRVSGGCSGMSELDKLEMIEYFVEGLRGFTGLVSSGATRDVTVNGEIDPMVTDVPAALLRAYGEDRILTLSTAPRTGDLALVNDSRLVIADVDDGHETCPNPGVHMIVIFQPEFSHEVFGWDGDVDPYFQLFNELRKNRWTWGMPVWNGGGVTLKEMVRAANSGWPVLVVNGSGRRADDIARYINEGTPIPGANVEISDAARQHFIIVDRDDPGTLASAVRESGLITV